MGESRTARKPSAIQASRKGGQSNGAGKAGSRATGGNAEKHLATSRPAKLPIKPLWTDEEIELKRQEELDALKEDDAGEVAPGSFGCHELLDRTSLVMSNVAEFILEHPACVRNKQWYSLAHQALEKLYHLYQDIGDKHIGAERP